MVRRGRKFGGMSTLVLLIVTGSMFARRSCRDFSSSDPGHLGGVVPETFTSRVVRVIDGDTIELEDGTSVRYIGVDCPERGEFLYREASNWNRRRVEGKEVRLSTDAEKRDRYGRLLSYVFLLEENAEEDPFFVNEEITREGLASYYEVSPNLTHRKALLEAQNAARQDRKGLWSKPAWDRPLENRYLASRRRFHRPDCRHVQDVSNPRELSNRGRAFDLGLTPCRNCKP